MDEDQLLQRLQLHHAWLEALNKFTESLSGSQLLLREVAFSGLKLVDADISSAEIVACKFTKCIFENCNFTASVLNASIFNDCVFTNCRFLKTDFIDADCSYSNFSDSDFTRADFTNAILKHATLRNCQLNWAWLVKTDMRYSTLDQVELEGTRLIKTKLFTDQSIKVTNFSQVVVEEVDVSAEADGSQLIGRDALERLLKKGHYNLIGNIPNHLLNAREVSNQVWFLCRDTIHRVRLTPRIPSKPLLR